MAELGVVRLVRQGVGSRVHSDRLPNKDNGRIRSYTYSVSDRSDPNTGVCSLCELLHPWCCLSKSVGAETNSKKKLIGPFKSCLVTDLMRE